MSNQTMLAWKRKQDFKYEMHVYLKGQLDATDTAAFVRAGLAAFDMAAKAKVGIDDNILLGKLYQGFVASVRTYITNFKLNRTASLMFPGISLEQDILLDAVWEVFDYARTVDCLLPDYVQDIIGRQFPRMISSVHTKLDAAYMANHFPGAWEAWQTILLLYPNTEDNADIYFQQWAEGQECAARGKTESVSLTDVTFEEPAP